MIGYVSEFASQYNAINSWIVSRIKLVMLVMCGKGGLECLDVGLGE